jgi:hypothetical protein
MQTSGRADLTTWIVAAIIAFGSGSRTVTAQTSHAPVERTAEALLAVYPGGGPDAASGAIGLGLHITVQSARGFGLRVGGRFMSSFHRGDNVAICRPVPGGACAPNPVYPNQMWTAEGATLLRPLASIPMNAVLGGGVVRATGDAQDDLGRWHGLLRWGFELGGDSGWHKPSLQVTRVQFRGPMQDLSAATTVSLMMRW